MENFVEFMCQILLINFQMESFNAYFLLSYLLDGGSLYIECVKIVIKTHNFILTKKKLLSYAKNWQGPNSLAGSNNPPPPPPPTHKKKKKKHNYVIMAP